MKNSKHLAPYLTRPNALIKIERELATRSLAEFVRQAWHVIEPATLLVWGFHIDAIWRTPRGGEPRRDSQLADQYSAAAHEEPARVGLLACMGVDAMA